MRSRLHHCGHSNLQLSAFVTDTVTLHYAHEKTVTLYTVP